MASNTKPDDPKLLPQITPKNIDPSTKNFKTIVFCTSPIQGFVIKNTRLIDLRIKRYKKGTFFSIKINPSTRKKSMSAAAILRSTKRNNTENNTDS